MTAASTETHPERVARPVLLTVDDDPSVSRSVARDLRRRYGADYRILRADSGAEALEVIKELVLRGEQVATILADYRMPQMNGVDFLEAAMDLVPQARRVLLTAYTSNHASIRVIEKNGGVLENVVPHPETGGPHGRYWIDLSST